MSDECRFALYPACEIHKERMPALCTHAAAALRAKVEEAQTLAYERACDIETLRSLLDKETRLNPGFRRLMRIFDIGSRAARERDVALARVRELEVNIAEMRQHHQKQLNSTFNLLATVLSSVGRTP